MINDKIRAELDQSTQAIVEYFPTLWFNLYKELLEKGFTEYQSLELVKSYLTPVVNSGSK